MQKKTEKRAHHNWTNTNTTLKHTTFTRTAKIIKRLFNSVQHNIHAHPQAEGVNRRFAEHEWILAKATTHQSHSRNWMR